MAELGPVSFPAQMTKELDGRPCPACGEPVASVLVDAVCTAKPADRPSSLGVVMVDVAGVPSMFTFQPCGCRTTPDGKAIPAEPLITVTARDAATGQPLDAEVTITPLPGASEWPSPIKSRRNGGRRERVRRR